MPYKSEWTHMYPGNYTEAQIQEFIAGNAWCILFTEDMHHGGQDCPPIEELQRKFTRKAWSKVEHDCRVFLWRVHKQGYDIPAAHMISAGVDYHFTRQGHGVGFWDSDRVKIYGEAGAKILDYCTNDNRDEIYVDKMFGRVHSIDNGITDITTGWEPAGGMK